MRALNPFTGSFYREALQMSRMTREMFCLMEGRHVHPSTLYPGGVGTVPTIQLFTDYLVRLMKYVEFMKKVVPLHDDLFDFFYDALPGYEEVGRRRVLLGCWGSFNNPDVCDYSYKKMTDWGRAMYVTPGIVVDDKLVTTDLVDINLNIRILLGSSYYDGWETGEKFVQKDPLGNPVDQNHPWNQTTIPRPQKRDLAASTLGLCRRGGSTNEPAIIWRSIPAAARLRAFGLQRWPGWWTLATSNLPAEASRCTCQRQPRCLKWNSNGKSRSGATPLSAIAPGPISRFMRPRRALFVEQALSELHTGRTKTWSEFTVPNDAIGCGFHEAVRGVLSHHVVIRDGKIANYHPYPPTPWNANPRDIYGTPGPYEDAVQNTPIFEENGPDKFKGIDIMRAVRSFDPCLPCGVHMYLGNGKVLETHHSPMFGLHLDCLASGRSGRGAIEQRAVWAGRVCLLDCRRSLVFPEGDYGADTHCGSECSELAATSSNWNRRRSECASPGEGASGIVDGIPWRGPGTNPGIAPEREKLERRSSGSAGTTNSSVACCLLYGLHPDNLTTRVTAHWKNRRAFLEAHSARPQNSSHPGDDGTVTVRLH